jgi:hypothetical protein
MVVVKGKQAYLKKLTSRVHIKSVEVDKELSGSTPPSVFIGSWNYPKVYAGPMMVPQHGDTAIVDSPEEWIPQKMQTQDIVGFRMSLVRGKQEVGITDLDNKLIEKLREISMSKNSIDSDVTFKSKPKGTMFTDEHTPHGPSGYLQDFSVSNCRWDHDLEKVYYDTDLKAADAVSILYDKGEPFSKIQKAFSVGTMGTEKRRKLVPTRWSITACDDTLGKMLLDKVKHYETIDKYLVYEFDSLNNYYAVILMPTPWQYEWIEAFLHVMGNEEVIFSDYEHNTGKKGYSIVGGCYYSCKFGVLQALEKMKRQAGAIILREAYKGYVPMGVFNVRENVRTAMKQKPKQFDDLRTVLTYLDPKFRLPISRFIKQGDLLRENLKGTQTTLSCFK